MKMIFSALLAVSLAFGSVLPASVFAAGPSAVALGSAGNFVILGKTAISTTGVTAITGNIGVSPNAGSSITGFALDMAGGNTYSNSARVTGKVYAADYTAPTPATMTTAIGDMQTAYTDAAGRTLPTATELGAGNIGGLTLAPGLYKWGTGVIIPTDVTLSGSANDVWIFQIAQNLIVSSAARVNLDGGAEASNIFWQVAGQATLGSTSVFNGNILSQTAIVLNTGARLNGRALAQSAVTLDANIVTMATAPATVIAPVVAPVVVAPVITPVITATPVIAPIEVATTNLDQSASAAFYEPSSPIAVVVAPSQEDEVRGIKVNLGQGIKNSNVTILQRFLIAQNTGIAAKNLSKAGATSYFGVLTRAALAEYQLRVGIKPPLGNFGPITRAYLSTHFN